MRFSLYTLELVVDLIFRKKLLPANDNMNLVYSYFGHPMTCFLNVF